MKPKCLNFRCHCQVRPCPCPCHKKRRMARCVDMPLIASGSLLCDFRHLERENRRAVNPGRTNTRGIYEFATR